MIFFYRGLYTFGCIIGNNGQVGMETVSKQIHTQLHFEGEMLAALKC